jgi:hypothetical protein
LIIAKAYLLERQAKAYRDMRAAENNALNGFGDDEDEGLQNNNKNISPLRILLEKCMCNLWDLLFKVTLVNHIDYENMGIKASQYEYAKKHVKVRESTYRRLQKFGQIGEPLDRAVTRVLMIAEKHKDELPKTIEVF